MLGSRYVIEHCIAAFLDKQKKENQELTCQLYSAKCLEFICNNTAFTAAVLKSKNCDYEIKTIGKELSEVLDIAKGKPVKEEKELDPKEVIEKTCKKLRGD